MLFFISCQVPFMLGDYITYAGVLSPSPDFDFAAYEVVGNLGIYTRVSLQAPVCI
jgi:hypothetical protein